MPLDLLLSVPHGAPANDRAGPTVGRLMLERAKARGLACRLLVSRTDRYGRRDMNRAEGRGTPFRRAVVEHVREGVGLHIDVHSFPANYPRFEGHDIVLLHTPGLTDRGWLEGYAALLEMAAAELRLGRLRAACLDGECPNDLIAEARENGLAPDAVMLAEHNDDGDHAAYAEAHAWASARVLGARRR